MEITSKKKERRSSNRPPAVGVSSLWVPVRKRTGNQHGYQRVPLKQVILQNGRCELSHSFIIDLPSLKRIEFCNSDTMDFLGIVVLKSECLVRE